MILVKVWAKKKKRKQKKTYLLEPQKLGFLSRISQNSKKIPKKFQKNSKKIPKKFSFWSKNSKMGSESTKLALNSNPIKIRGFLSHFGSIWAILGPMESLESLESLRNSQKIQLLVKKFKVGLKKHKTGTKSGSD